METQFYSFTNPQKSIWYTEKYFQGTNINNICGTMTIQIPIDFEKFILAIKQFVKQNDGCRIKLSKENEELQYIAPYEDFPIEIVNVQSDREVNKLASELAGRPFTLYNTYLFQFVVYRFPDNHGGFIINMHHLISDSWALGILVNEIISIYSALLKGESLIAKSSTDYSYIQYILAEREYQKSNKYEKDKQYWNDLFNTIPDIASISGSITQSAHSDKEKEDVKIENFHELQAQREELSISASLLEKIKEFCTSHKVSIFNFLIAIYAIYVGRVSNLDDFCFGTPILNRSNVKEKNTMGMFINTLPLRIHLNQQLDFQQFLSSIATNSMALLRHQKYSYQTILQDLRKKQRDLPALYKIMISYQITKMDQEQDTIPHKSTWFFNHTIADDIDIHIFDLNDANLLNIAYDYKINKYTPDDMRKIHKRIEYIISQILEKESILLSDIQIVTPEEQKQLLYDFNKTSFDYPKEKTMAQLFEEQVLLTPDKTAIVFEGKSLTYAQLNEKANQLAHFLRNNGVKNNSIIGIMVGRSLEMIVSILAVLKSGGAYIPIDPDYPEDRIAYLLENSHCTIVLTQKDLFPKITISCKMVDVSLPYTEIASFSKENLPCISKPDDLSYLIYTSGSTGLPKGVMLTQKALTNLTYYCNDYIPYLKNREDKAIVSVTTVSFDIFIFETLISLQRGLKLVIANHQEQTIPHCLDDLIAKENIEIIQTTPSRMQLFYNSKEDMPHLQNLKYITLAGEPLPLTLKNNLLTLTHGRIYNGYGPSETTVFSTLTDVTNQKQITIGKPLYNTQIYILDSNLKPCSIGTTGELYIAGDGVGHGYMERPDLTQKSFIPNPFVPNTIMYKTGDTGTFLPNGEILCFGRVDHQVKIRGLRIELEEIEKQIMNFPGIENCCTVKKVTEEGHEFLCSYYTAKSTISLLDLRQALQKKLPNYMIPQYFIPLEQMPYTPNGKIDKKALPEPDLTQSSSQKQTIPARNEIDSTLLTILEELLKVHHISIQDSFYDLGGDSLSAIQLCSILYHQLNIQLSVKDILAHPIIQDLSDFISTQVKGSTMQITSSEKREYYPASSAQKRVYYASAMQPDSVVYNIAGGLLLDQIPDITNLEDCLKKLIARHSSLRTYFAIQDGDLVQKIVEHVDFHLETEQCYYSDKEKLVNKFVKPFSLHEFPLFRAKLLLFENQKALLLLDMHHSISDGTSLTILLEELSILYNNGTLPEKTIDYPDFAIWEEKYKHTSAYLEDKNYWLNQFETTPPVLEMPACLPRPITSSFEGNSIYLTLSPKLSSLIMQIAKHQNMTPYMILLTAYFILLYKYTNQEEFVVGTPIMNRETPELENVLGMFVNNLAIRSSINSSMKLKDYLQSIKDLCLNAFAHQAYPFDELVKELKLKRETNRNPLFDTMFIYQNNGYPPIQLGEIPATYFVPENHIAKFDLSLEIIPKAENFELHFEYATNLFTKTYIENLVTHYQNILETLVENLEIPIAQMNMLSKQEEDEIKNKLNNTYTPYNKEITILDLFEQQVKNHPNQDAIVFENTVLTYQELNEKANQLAHYLVESQGIKRNQIVGVLLYRSIETVISILAILKSGAAYLLIDHDLPFDRILYMLENSHAVLLISNTQMKKINFSVTVTLDTIPLENFSKNNLDTYLSNEDLLSVVYTSGSTGLPKGVLVKKLGMANLILSYQKHIHIQDYDTFLSICSISFDMFGVEIWVPLINGKRIILANEEQCKIPTFISDLIHQYQVEYMLITPSKLQLLLDNNDDCLSILKSIQLGGEALTPSLYQKLANKTSAIICNEYGPSECTSCSTYQVVTDANYITIGKPFCNTQIYICDRDGNLRPIGFDGEICISGDGITNGYVNQKDLTNEVFIPNPFGEGKLYKTGDIGQLNTNYDIVYKGRKDFQVKIRGLRIELSEIEKQISLLPHITNVAVVCIKEDDMPCLISYFTANQTMDIHKLREALGKKLPDYMVPKYFIQREQLPLSANGKIDKKMLENLKVEKVSTSVKKVLPENDTQKLYCDIWSSLLKTEVGIDDDIFELGTDSLLAIKFKTELLAHDINIPYADIFQYKTVRQLSQIHQSTSTIADVKNQAIQEILQKNKIATLSKPLIHHENQNVLLLGGNGFVGTHILYELAKHHNGKIYCIIRDKNGESGYVRFLKILHFYFGNELDSLINHKIYVIVGSILEECLGLKQNQFEELMQNVSVVINAAAIVKHYGSEDKFKTINVDVTQKLVNICMQYHKRLLHISSTSVAGNSVTEKYQCFSECNLDIGQNLDNIYIRSKFEAEKLILEGITNGLNAQILRLGNITNRYYDGKFQINPTENSFFTKLRSFIELQIMPKTLANTPLEFTPVDICAKAIALITRNELKEASIFHLYDDHYITMGQLVDCLIKQDLSISFVTSDVFNQNVKRVLQDSSKKDILFGIVNDFNLEDDINYTSSIELSSDFTKAFLQKLHFDWPKIDEQYIQQYIQYFKNINLI